MGGTIRTNTADVAGRDTARRKTARQGGFTLVELLVVIGIMVILISLLMPSFVKARAMANSAFCASNLRQLGVVLQLYCNDNNGWLYPVGPTIDGKPSTLGAPFPPHQRWPMRVAAFEINTPEVMPYDPAEYMSAYNSDPRGAAGNEEKFPTAPYTPPMLKCPADPDAGAAHTYVLNKHLADKHIRASTKDFGGLTSSQVIVAGEKKTEMVDYYMERNEFGNLVEKYMHGVYRGSNYLHHDGHVDMIMPKEAAEGLDPWEPKLPDATSKPS